MTCSSSRIDLAGRRLLSSIAGTREARVSAMALAQMGGAGKTLMGAGLLVQRGSARFVVAEDDLDDIPTSIIAHPITGHHGHLGNAAWQDEQASARRRVYALDIAAAARRVVARLDCSLGKDPVPYLDGAVLDFGTARLPKRRARGRDLGRSRSNDAGGVRGVQYRTARTPYLPWLPAQTRTCIWR
ncbi:hypothetical protein ACFHYO_14165 [Paracoccus panacisoli]|uniref:Uncharacterized protein n=1 Tax=Paracoccus panacisoli TaxID=1510163 RepID=A0ABV6T7J5_9RHOB